MRRPRALSSRLVTIVVMLVVGTTLLVGLVTTLAMRTYLTGQLDRDVRDALQRVESAPARPDHGPSGRPDSRGPDIWGQAVGTLNARFGSDGSVDFANALVDVKGGASLEELDEPEIEALGDVSGDGDPQTIDLGRLGEYRVLARETDTGDRVVAGLPTDDVDNAVTTLVVAELVLIVAAGFLAAGTGRIIVRRQLRPLTEVASTAHNVAALPLDSGEIGVTERVPAHLTDEHTEVGQVGLALNTLLAHVETSLDARHASEQRVRQFVADASHELRTPLTTIAGYTELARRRPDDPAVAATALAKVEDESQRMTALVEDLLLLARLDSGRPLERGPVDLTRLLLEAVADARVVAPEHHWRLELPEEAVEVAGDEHRLHQVLTNLLTNARKYTPAGTTVTLTARPDGFTVHDDGPGFPPELLPHAFERFARADAARQREGGVGLGLALVEAIVTAHGGTVALASVPGDTRIDVRLG